MYSFPFPAIFPLYFPFYQKVAAIFVNRLISILTFSIVNVVILHKWCWFRTLQVLAFEAGRKHGIRVNTISAGEDAQLRNNFFECVCFVSSIGDILHWFSYINRSEMSMTCSAIYMKCCFSEACSIHLTSPFTFASAVSEVHAILYSWAKIDFFGTMTSAVLV
jgi:hypothetical protein